MKAKDFFTKEQKEEITSAIKEAELNTSGEIRVHIENSFKGNVLDRASDIFKMLQMHKTELRNGVLFYLAIKNKEFAILGDGGINAKVPEIFCDNIKDKMLDKFKEEKNSEGLSLGIKMAGEQLKIHFPYQADDVNELSDDISFGEN